jgi:DNA-binding GntR family transcriptional regulator
MSGTLKPGQRLVERELCEMMASAVPPIREALRHLEADGLVNTVPHRGPVVSTSASRKPGSSTTPGRFWRICGRECARLRDPDVVHRIGDALTRLKAAAAKQDLVGCLEAKTDFYGALIGGCRTASSSGCSSRFMTASRCADHFDVPAEADQQEPARSDRDLARDPERR